MIDALKQMIGSKKAIAAIVSPVVAYILSQGYVDRGKASPTS